MLNTNHSLRIFFLQLKQAALVALLIFASSSGQADDTDIYMGTGTSDAAETHPNVLFILDTSGSMNARDAGANRRTSRMKVLKEAMDDLLTTLDNVNVGISRFSNSGGSVIFPISPINGNANIVVGEATSTKALEFKAVLVNDTDDAEERVSGNSAGQVFLNDDVLEMFDFGGTTGQSGTTTVEVAINSDDSNEFNGSGGMLNTTFAYIHRVVDLGLRFQSVNIAQGATIQSAFLDFTTRNRNTSRANVTIKGLNIGNTNTFSSTRRDLSSRATTNAIVAWDGIPGTARNKLFSSPDVATIVQEIVNRSDWQSGNAMGLVIKTSQGFRLPHSRNSSSTRQPKLRIQMQAVAGAEGDDQLIALRFEDIRIPRGAVLQEAKLLITNSAAGGSSSVTWQIQAEQVDDSTPLSSATNNLSSRKGGGTVVNWTVDNATLNTAPASTTCSVTTATGAANTCADQFTGTTNDIKRVVNEITNRSGWCGGNAITFLIDASSPNADQIRKLYSSDSAEAALAPKFVYSYMPQKGCMSSLDVSQIASSGDDAEQYTDSYAGSRVDTVGDNLVLGVDPQNGSQTVGLRFTAVEVPKGVTVKEAHIEFRAKGTSTGAADYTIKAVNVGSVGPIGNSTNAISDPPTTTASASWSLSGANAEDNWDSPGAEHLTPDLTAVVQEVVNRTDWSSQNNMGFVITGTGTRTAESFDSDPSKAPRLVIKYDDSKSIPFKSVREVLKEKVKELPARGGTPIAGAMVETAKYFRGETMVHGKNRGSFGQISHPATYCNAPGNCPGATPTTSGGGYYGGRGGVTDEFMVLNPSGCSKNNLGSSACRNRKINGNPRYLSPIKTDLECASNHQVLLTDGQAGGSDANRIKQLTGKSRCHTDNTRFKLPEHNKHVYSRQSYYGSRQTAESCVPDLVEFMATEDQNKNIAGKQNVKTHTVAFALKSAGPVQFLKDVANLGGGGFYSADTAGDLQDVFQVILSDVRSAPSSFAAPALAIDAFNKLTSRSDVYYGMFTPELTQRWNGNIKKYKLCLKNDCGKLGDVLDADDNSVVDTTDPKRPVFKTNSRSVWSTAADGQAVTQGGAGSRIEDFKTVTLLTDKKDTTTSFGEIKGKGLLELEGFFIEHDNWQDDSHQTIRAAICKNPSNAAGSECEKRMLWMLGKKHVTDAANDPTSDERWSVGDVLHSSPVVITYGGSPGTPPTFIDKVVYGTNAGYLHMIDGDSGIEDWRYMPSDFWPAQRQLFDNRQDKHMYGMDSTPTVWMCDVNQDGIINPITGTRLADGEQACGTSSTGDDFVRIITATRRGGGANGFIYALDLSHTALVTNGTVIDPAFMWRIAGGDTTGPFSRLGQTWSQPKIATILVNGGSGIYPKNVLIFGGGYDIKLDDSTKFSPDDNDGNDYLGNAIYIVDPMNGKKILSISGTGSGADIEIQDMHFSIPSRVQFLDSNIDGLTDRLYVGDLGGQVWRVDLAEAIPMTGSPSVGTVVGRLAAVSGNDASNRRRFFEPPSIVQVSDELFADEPEYDYVLMGSGNRPNPLEETVNDRFYAFRDRHISNNALTGSTDPNIAGQGDGYPDTTSSAYSHADVGSLINVTQKGMAELAAVDENLIKDSNGWFIDYSEANAGRAGEKTLSSPLTAGGAVSFTTFDPITDATGGGTGTGGVTSKQAKKNDPCSASPNIGTARAYHLTILGADAPEISEIGGGRGANRYRKVIGSGIPSDVIPVFTDQGVIGIVQSDGVPTSLGQLSSTTPERAYWNESIDF